MKFLKKLNNMLLEALLTGKELDNIAKQSIRYQQENKVDLYDAVVAVVDNMIKNNQHPAVTKSSKKFTIRSVVQNARQLNKKLKENIDLELTPDQMKDILHHAKLLVKKGIEKSIEDAILSQLEHIPGLEMMDHEELVKNIMDNYY